MHESHLTTNVTIAVLEFYRIGKSTIGSRFDEWQERITVMVPPDQSCSEISVAAGESLLGTAPEVTFWILLEYRSQWAPKVTDDNDLPIKVQEWLQTTIDSLQSKDYLPRVQFVRQSRRAAMPSLRLYVGRDGELRTLEISDYLELKDLDVEQDVVQKVEGEHYFVCTHGTRDPCCSKYGIATWRKLYDLTDGRAWQTSHLGGHRYAPNVLVLPHGRLYGRVQSECAEDFFKTIESGAIAEDHLRGRSEFPKEAQACECLVDVPVVSVQTYDESTVRFRTKNGDAEVSVPPRGEEISILASCKDSEMECVRPFSETS